MSGSVGGYEHIGATPLGTRVRRLGNERAARTAQLPSELSPGALPSAFQMLLKPLVRLLLRNGVAFGAFTELAKKVFVDVAREEFTVPGRRPTISATAVLTGLTRKEVSRVERLPSADLPEKVSRYNRATRVVTGWALDPRFVDSDGQPLALAFDGAAPSFSDLVRAFSGDMPVRAVLDELLRTGAAVQRSDGRIVLRTRAFVPSADADEKVYILGADVADLIACIEHNLVSPGQAFFQRKVAYDRLVSQALGPLKQHVRVHAQKLLEDLNERMAPFDRDFNPNVEGTGTKRAMIGIYYYEEDALKESLG